MNRLLSTLRSQRGTVAASDSEKRLGHDRALFAGGAARFAFLRNPVRPIPARWHMILLGVVAVTWIVSIRVVDPTDIGELGTVSVLPVVAFVALGALVIGFSLSVSRPSHRWLLPAYEAMTVVLLHGLPVFSYQYLRYSWAWKHAGIVDYIMRHDAVDRSIATLSVYHNWPGFFGLNALVSSAAGLDSALSYAAWAPIFFNLLFAAAVYVIVASATRDQRLIWLSVWLFTVANWVGQDYFAPQSLAFFLYLSVFAILLRFFPAGTGRHRGESAPPGSAQAKSLILVVFFGLVAIAISHQLTPIMAIVALGALVGFRVIRVRWMLIIMAAVTGVWMFWFARDFVLANLGKVLDDFGGLQANVDAGLIEYAKVSWGQKIVSLAARGLSGGMLALAVTGYLRGRTRSVAPRSALLLALAPFFLVVASPYGQEVLFRAYLFALPFLAFLGATLWFTDVSVEPTVRSTLSLALVGVVIVGVFLIAEFGSDERMVFTSDEVAAATYVDEIAPPGSLLVEGSRDYPAQFLNYEHFTYAPIDRASDTSIDKITNAPVETLTRWMSDPAYRAAYVLITRSQKNSVARLGSLPPPGLDGLEATLIASDRFRLVFDSEDARVFVLENP